MLNLTIQNNTWKPNQINEADIISQYGAKTDRDCLIIIRSEPYIDALFVSPRESWQDNSFSIKRFVFHEDYTWNYDDERFFEEKCVNNSGLEYSHSLIEKIYKYYSAHHPEWHLQRYYTKGIRILEHIYHCQKKNTVKEILYKAGLDYLAARSSYIDEVNLLATKPSEIYDGLSIRILRALNCEAGAKLLLKSENRGYLMDLNAKFPDIFSLALNDAQCMYLEHLINGDLTVGETGRLYLARRPDLMRIWNLSQYYMFVAQEESLIVMAKTLEAISEIDPVYANNADFILDNAQVLSDLKQCLLVGRKDLDKAFRRSNRKRNADWQERLGEYFVRYPQTVNDFCREAVYMHNCLMAYLTAVIHNDTTILFMRRECDYNQPFITIEVFEGTLIQAYHRFNEDCTEEEADWIREYCKRHGIRTDRFCFDANRDQLF